MDSDPVINTSRINANQTTSQNAAVHNPTLAQVTNMAQVAKSAVKAGACATYAAIAKGFNDAIDARVNFPKNVSAQMQRSEEIVSHLLHMYTTWASTPKAARPSEPQAHLDQITNEADIPAYEAQIDVAESDARGNEKYTLVCNHIQTGLKNIIRDQISDLEKKMIDERLSLDKKMSDEIDKHSFSDDSDDDVLNYLNNFSVPSHDIKNLQALQLNLQTLLDVKKLRDRLSQGPTKEMSPLSSTIVMSLPGLSPKTTVGTPQGKCEFYTAKALYALENPEKFSNKREAFREYKDCLRKALESEHYKNNPDSIVSQLLNKLAFCEFTKVNVQGLVESVAQKSAEEGGIKNEPYKPNGEEPQKQHINIFNKALVELDEYHQAIKDFSKSPEGIYSSIKGEIMCMGLDSTVQGNPTNVKCKMEDVNGKEIINVRTPTPTGKDGKVTPEFKAFLREIKSQGKKYTMINLQDRRHPGMAKVIMNREGEMIRSRNLELLQSDPEFAGMFTCFTLDKNSEFYMQEAKGDQNAESFIDEFMDKLTNDPSSGFFIPPSFLAVDGREKAIKGKLEMLHQTLFKGQTTLSNTERQDLIEAAYIFLADYYIKETQADFYNESCKDCIDRGGGANWTMMGTMNALEIFDSSRKHADSSDLSERLANMPADLECDALWARKRPIIRVRLDRAKNVMSRIITSLDEKPELADQYAKELNLRKLKFQADIRMATKDPRFEKK